MAREVVITGGGTGIGLAIAESFAAAGERVTITGRREEVLASAAETLHGIGGTVTPVAFDAGDPAAVAAALPRLPDRVDVLVNNAGGNLSERPRPADGGLPALAEEWHAMMNLNVLTAVLVTEALRPRLGDGARVVNLGSIAARSGAGAYGAAKAAIEAYSVSLATALGARGITVNVVSPGLILDTEFFRGKLTEAGIARRVERTLNGRAGTPADVAEAVTFLASAGAGHITGQVLHVNGGAHLGS